MDATRYKGYYIKLRITEDADVIAVLDDVKNRQGYIRDLIRKDIVTLDAAIKRHNEESEDDENKT